MDKQSIVNFMQLEEVTGVKLLDDDLTSGPVFIKGAAAQTFNNVSVNREILAVTLEKLADIARSEKPNVVATDHAGFVFDDKQIAQILVTLTDNVSSFLMLEQEILQGEEPKEGVSLIDQMRAKMLERRMHDVSKMVYDYGQISKVPSSAVRDADKPVETEYALTLTEHDIDQMREYLGEEVHHTLITAFNQRVELHEQRSRDTIQQRD